MVLLASAAISLTTILDLTAVKYCAYRAQDLDRTKSVIMALTHVQEKYGANTIRQAVRGSNNLGVLAAAMATTKCPNRV